MSSHVNKPDAKTGSATSAIPREEWGRFLEAFERKHRGWLTRLEIFDRETEESVAHEETRLNEIELDLEDERNPRINVSVRLDNKVVKHILFQPSHVVLNTASDGLEDSLQIATINTETTIRFRPPVS